MHPTTRAQVVGAASICACVYQCRGAVHEWAGGCAQAVVRGHASGAYPLRWACKVCACARVFVCTMKACGALAPVACGCRCFRTCVRAPCPHTQACSGGGGESTGIGVHSIFGSPCSNAASAMAAQDAFCCGCLECWGATPAMWKHMRLYVCSACRAAGCGSGAKCVPRPSNCQRVVSAVSSSAAIVHSSWGVRVCLFVPRHRATHLVCMCPPAHAYLCLCAPALY